MRLPRFLKPRICLYEKGSKRLQYNKDFILYIKDGEQGTFCKTALMIIRKIDYEQYKRKRLHLEMLVQGCYGMM